MNHLSARFCLLAALLDPASVFAAAPARPHLVIMLSDDHTLVDSSVYGSKDVKTPNMQRLARAGLTFDRAFVASPSCAPSRAALLTGLMPARNGAEANHSKPRAELKAEMPAELMDPRDVDVGTQEQDVIVRREVQEVPLGVPEDEVDVQAG